MELQDMLDFLSALEQNNDRAWFHTHKPNYTQAKACFENLVQAFLLELGKRDAGLLNCRPGELMFQLNRDTRFSKDKSPYNPAFRAHISSAGKLPVPVGCFLFVRPGDRSFLGGGLFADVFRDATAQVRDHIAAHGDQWADILTAPDFAQRFTVQGAALKKVPQGYDPAHPQAQFLKNKSWYVEYPVTDRQLTAPDFVARASEHFALMEPFHCFMNTALANFTLPQR